MNRTARYLGITLLLKLSLSVPGVWAQQPMGAEPQGPSHGVQTPQEVVAVQAVPRLVKFAGTLKDELGKPLSGVMSVSFAVYKEQEGGATLWLETQNVELDEQGHYTVLLGSTKSEGLPLELFTSGEPRWLGAQVNLPKGVEQPRVLLVSVPYALKAADADTVGGLPASAFVLAGSSGTASVMNTSGTATSANTKTAGAATAIAANFIPVFTDNTGTLGSSAMFQSGGFIGVGTTTPAAALHVSGDTLLVTSATTAQVQFSGTASAARFGEDGNGAFFASDSPGKAVRFYTNNGTLNEGLRVTSAGNVGIGTAAPGQRLEVAGNLKISGGGSALVFADGSVMSSAATGVGGGTITGVTAGTGLTGGGTTGGVTLNIASGGITNALLGANSVTNANIADGSLSQTKIAGVAATLGPNSFTGNQLVIGEFHVGTGNNWFRVEGPNPGTASPVLASWGGAGDFSIDAPGVIGGRMVVKDSSGNVGIGTPTPGQKLEVAGNIKVSGAGSGLIFQDGTTQTTHQIIVPVGINDFIQQFGTPTQTKVSYGVLIPVPCWTIPQATGGTCIIATTVIPPGVTTPPTLIIDVQAAASGTAAVNVGSSGVAANAAPPSNCISFDTTQNLVFTAANTMQRFSTDVSNLAVCGATPAVNAGPGDILVFRICNSGSAGFLGFSVTSVEFVWH